MEHYAGLDVSLELSSVCIVDERGTIVSEVKVASEPEALIRFLLAQELVIVRVGLEAGPLSQWLHAGLVTAGFETVLLETRAREGGIVGDDGKDRPARCPRDRSVA